MRKLQLVQIVLIFMLTMSLALVGEWIANKWSLLDEFNRSMDDFDFTDLYYKNYLDTSSIKVDQNIVLVNIGNRSRLEIAMMIDSLNQFSPAVVGMHVFFYSPHENDPFGDSVLISSVKNCRNFVFAGKIREDTLRTSFSTLQGNKPVGIVDWYEDTGNFNVPKGFNATFKTDRSIYNSFSLELVRFYNPDAFKTFMTSNQGNNLITYSGNMMDYGLTKYGKKYATLDHSDILEPLFDPDSKVYKRKFYPEFVQGKIIIFTFLGGFIGDIDSPEDKFYSPLNTNIFNPYYPDMFGGVVHANIITSILENNLARRYDWLDWSCLITICLLFTAWFRWLMIKTKTYYNLVSKIIAFVAINMIIIGAIQLFGFFHLRIEIKYLVLFLLFLSDGTEFAVKLSEDLKFDRFFKKVKNQ